jgi:hypothetical protein
MREQEGYESYVLMALMGCMNVVEGRTKFTYDMEEYSILELQFISCSTI